MNETTLSLLLILACFGGVAWIARANHLILTDPATGRSPKYWQPWRVWIVGGAFGALLLYGAFIALTVDLH